MCVRACVCVHACARVFMQACLQYTHTHSLTQTHTHTYTHRQTCSHTPCAKRHAAEGQCVCVCVRACGCTHAHTCTHTPTHVHVRARTCKKPPAVLPLLPSGAARPPPTCAPTPAQPSPARLASSHPPDALHTPRAARLRPRPRRPPCGLRGRCRCRRAHWAQGSRGAPAPPPGALPARSASSSRALLAGSRARMACAHGGAAVLADRGAQQQQHTRPHLPPRSARGSPGTARARCAARLAGPRRMLIGAPAGRACAPC